MFLCFILLFLYVSRREIKETKAGLGLLECLVYRELRWVITLPIHPSNISNGHSPYWSLRSSLCNKIFCVLFPLLFRGDLALMGREACQQKMWGTFHLFCVTPTGLLLCLMFQLFLHYCEQKDVLKLKMHFFFLHREKTDQRETSGKRLLKCIANKKNIYLFYKYDMIFQCASLFRGTREIQVPMWVVYWFKTKVISVRKLRLHL